MVVTSFERGTRVTRRKGMPVKKTGLVLAAGLSSRMGEFKPLMRMGGQTLLAACVQSLFAGGATHVTVVLGHRAQEVEPLLRAAFDAKTITLVTNDAYAQSDMLASIRVGLEAMPSCDAFYLLPGDMPAVSPQTLRALAAAMAETNARVVFPTLNGRRKHPPLIAASCINDMRLYRGSNGLRGVWDTYTGGMVDVPVEDAGCGMDADTPEDFDRLTRYLTLKP